MSMKSNNLQVAKPRDSVTVVTRSNYSTNGDYISFNPLENMPVYDFLY